MAKTQAHEFGRYLRSKRNDYGMSLRALADKLDVSAVYLGEVERGVRGPMKKSHWDKLVKALPNIDKDDLARLSIKSRPVQLHLSDSPPQYQNLALALSRRIERQNLSNSDLKKLFSILDENDE